MFSFSKLSREGRVILEHRRAAGYRTLAFVSRTCIPPEEQADISLFAYRGEEKEYHSMAAPTALLDVLTVAVTSRLGQRGTDSLAVSYTHLDVYKRQDKLQSNSRKI